MPTEVEIHLKNYYEILKYVVENSKIIMKYRDNHSKVVKKFIDIIGIERIKKRDVNNLEGLVFFIDDINKKVA